MIPSIDAPKWRMLILIAVSFLASWLIFRPVLKVAIKKNLVDNPNARKLQKSPVPVMGGIVVFFGIMIGLMFFKTMVYQTTLLPILGAMMAMMYIGALDDILDISAVKRLVFEIVIALLMIYGNKFCIFDFGGLWGLYEIPIWIAVPLTVLMFVGVVNALNMIDGIDGLLSGFGLMICGLLGILCFLGHDYSSAALSFVTCGALLPFFLHNVFGYTSKMFLGDAGSMILGTIVSALIINILSGKFSMPEVNAWCDFNFAAFALAVISIPVADTLRVMFLRIIKGKSPMSPDKTHLHHCFVSAGFSFIFTTISMIMLNIIVIAVFFLVWKAKANADIQLYSVIITALVLDVVSAEFLNSHIDRLKVYSLHTHVERKGLWLHIQKLIDGDSASFNED